MPAEVALVDPPDNLWCVEWKEPPLRFSSISPAEAVVDGAGNRFDIPGAGVLYAATTPEGSFAETMAHYRPKASLIEKMARAANDGQAPPPAGVLDVSWRSTRMLRRLETVDALPFIDIESPETHTFIRANAPTLLRSLNVENLDVPSVRGPSRLLTRGIAGWIYGQTDDEGTLQYGGIRYVSRLGDYECWAIFDGTDVSRVRGASDRRDEPGHGGCRTYLQYGHSVTYRRYIVSLDIISIIGVIGWDLERDFDCQVSR